MTYRKTQIAVHVGQTGNATIKFQELGYETVFAGTVPREYLSDLRDCLDVAADAVGQPLHEIEKLANAAGVKLEPDDFDYR